MPSVQYKVLGIALGFSLAMLVAQGISVAFAVNRVAGLAPDQSALILQELPLIIRNTVAVAFILLVPFVLAVVMGAMHRFVGPVNRMQDYMKDQLAGKQVGSLRLRKGDVLIDMAGLVEQVVKENQALRDQLEEHGEHGEQARQVA